MWHVVSAGKRVTGGKRGKTHVRIIERDTVLVSFTQYTIVVACYSKITLTKNLSRSGRAQGETKYSFALDDVQNTIRAQAVTQ